MLLAVDTETTGTDFFHGCRAFMITACDGSSNYWWSGEVNPYTREVFWDENDLAEASELIYSAKTLIMHNGMFDMRALETLGINIRPLWSRLEDTLIAAHAINAAHEVGDSKGSKKRRVGRSLGLKDLAIEYFRYWDDDEKALEVAVKQARQEAPREYAIAKKGHPHFPGIKTTSWWKMDFWLAKEECLKYACKDVERTFLLWSAFKPSLIGDSLWEVYQLRKQLQQICYDIVSEGMYFDSFGADKYIAKAREAMEELRREMKRIGGIEYKFEPTKEDHIRDLLHNRCNIPITFRTDSGRASVNKEALKYYTSVYNHEAIDVLRQWKLLETKARYVESYVNWVHEDRIHSNVNPTGTRETRQSSNSPNQQNITGELERFFLPEEGFCVFDADFENIEMRIWAYSVNNQEMVEAFNQGQSIHMMVFNELFPREAKLYEQIKNKPKEEFNEVDRKLANLYRDIKSFNFAIIYGATEDKADATIGRKGAYKKLINRYPEIETFTSSLTAQVYRNLDYYGVPSVITLGGYRLPVPLDEPYKACNFFVQGSAGIITSKAMVRIGTHPDYIDSGSKMFRQVHDSLRIKIPICKETNYLVQLFADEMELAGEELIPTCRVSYTVSYPRLD